MGNDQPKTNLAAELRKRNPFSSLQQETYINLIRTHEHLTTELAQLFKRYGVSDSQYNVLRILRGTAKPMQIYQIAEQLIYAQADISRLVSRLCKARLIARKRCEQDGRVAWITLTDTGKRLLKKMDKPLKQLHESQFSDLSDRELATLNELLFRARKSNRA